MKKRISIGKIKFPVLYLFLLFYILFILLQIKLRTKGIAIYTIRIQTDFDLLTGLLYLFLIYSATIALLTWLVNKITNSSLQLSLFFIFLTTVLTGLFDLIFFKKLYHEYHLNFLHKEYDAYLFTVFAGILTLSLIPLYFIGKNRKKRQEAIDKATGRIK